MTNLAPMMGNGPLTGGFGTARRPFPTRYTKIFVGNDLCVVPCGDDDAPGWNDGGWLIDGGFGTAHRPFPTGFGHVPPSILPDYCRYIPRFQDNPVRYELRGHNKIFAITSAERVADFPFSPRGCIHWLSLF